MLVWFDIKFNHLYSISSYYGIANNIIINKSNKKKQNYSFNAY